MYELSVAQELYCQSRVRADELGVRELQSVRVGIGDLAGVSPGLLRSAWKFVTSESADENSELEIVMTPVRQVCPQCGAVPEAHSYPSHCDRCKCHMRVESGDRIELLDIRFQQELQLI